MSFTANTPPPPSPANGPSDWTRVVQGNSFSNIQRLGQWTGRQTVVTSDPSPYFNPVAPESLGAGANPPTIYVLVHGWAPGYRAAVSSQGGNLLWWGSNASVNGIWSSNWAWSPVIAPLKQAFPVNPIGFLQSIVALDPDAIVLAYSWIDDSATESGDLNLDEVYASEAYTHVNGIRLANALEQAITSSFWNADNGLLRLIGHSHGSKVATVAALTLQQWGRPVAHLTVLDSPDGEMTLAGNGANLLGFYLEQMQIENASLVSGAGAFVDNYASYFGVGYTGTPNLESIVEVGLDASKLYKFDDMGDQHSYAAAWYGGAAAGAAKQKEPPLGLAWPPPPSKHVPALNQTWPAGNISQSNQWWLQPGPMIGDTYSYTTQSLPVTKESTQGNVKGDPTRGLTLGYNQGAYSIFQGSYTNSPLGDGYGLAFDLLWTAPQIGDYLVVTMESPEERVQETLLVIDGQSSPAGKTSIAINCDASSGLSSLHIYIYFFAELGHNLSQVNLSNFRLVIVGSESGYLRCRRVAAALEKSAQRGRRIPGKLKQNKAQHESKIV